MNIAAWNIKAVIPHCKIVVFLASEFQVNRTKIVRSKEIMSKYLVGGVADRILHFRFGKLNNI